MNSLDKREDYDALKQERDELAAQVEDLREALLAEVDYCDTSKTNAALQRSDNRMALREIEARTLEHAADHEDLYDKRDVLRSMAAAKRKGE